MKQKIYRNLKELDLDRGLDDLIKELTSYKEQFSQYHDLRIERDYDWEGSYTYNLRGFSMETDEEEQSRLSLEEESERKNTEYQRKQYELLKQKFEKR